MLQKNKKKQPKKKKWTCPNR